LLLLPLDTLLFLHLIITTDQYSSGRPLARSTRTSMSSVLGVLLRVASGSFTCERVDDAQSLGLTEDGQGQSTILLVVDLDP